MKEKDLFDMEKDLFDMGKKAHNLDDEKLPLISLEKKLFFKKLVIYFAVSFVLVVVCSIDSACVQVLGGYIPNFQLSAFRFSTQTLFMSILFCKDKCAAPDIKYKTTYCWLLLGSILLSTNNLTFYSAASLLPLGTLKSMDICMQLVTITALTTIFRSDRKCLTYLCVVLCISGTLLVVQPSELFPNSKNNFEINTTLPCLNTGANQTNIRGNASASHSFQTTIGYINVTIAGFCLGLLGFIINSKLSDIRFSFLSTWLSLGGLVICVLVTCIIETPVWPSSHICIALLAGHMIAASSYSVLYQLSMRLFDPVAVSLLLTLEVLAFMTIQYTVLSNILPGHKNWIEILGSVLILLGIAINNTKQIIFKKLDSKPAYQK